MDLLPPEAYIWDSTNGMRSLQDVLTDEGLDLTGWTLHVAHGISADGKTIVGWGVNPDGNTEAWIAHVSPVPIPGAMWLLSSGLISLMGIRKRLHR
jgi:uncharacterized membrane protein